VISSLQNQTRDADATARAIDAHLFKMLQDVACELGRPVDFPTSFNTALRLRQALEDPDLPTVRIAAVVGLEPLIATRVMNLAKSVIYGTCGTPVRDLHTAIDRLGVEVVRTAALGIAMSQLVHAREMASFSDIAQVVWNHSVRSAAAARILARTQTRINPDEALLAGLVHDLGAFYMLFRAVHYPELRSRPDAVKSIILQLHESIGVTLLKALGMSDEVVDATIDHDQIRPGPIAVRTLADIVYYSNFIAGSQGEWFSGDVDPNNGEPGVVRRHFKDLLAGVEADTGEMLAVFA